MFIVAVAATAAVITGLIAVVRGDSPTTPPRSHHDEVDHHSMYVV
jgi:hypothetical protein